MIYIRNTRRVHCHVPRSSSTTRAVRGIGLRGIGPESRPARSQAQSRANFVALGCTTDQPVAPAKIAPFITRATATALSFIESWLFMTSSPKRDRIKVSQDPQQFNVEWPVWDECVGFRDELDENAYLNRTGQRSNKALPMERPVTGGNAATWPQRSTRLRRQRKCPRSTVRLPLLR